MKVIASARALLLLAAGGFGALAYAGAPDMVTTAISARTGNGYERQRLPDGSFKVERYALANGGRIAGTTSDLTMDRIDYPQIATLAMQILARQNYVYAQTEQEADLMLVLYWGSTIPGSHPNYAQQVNNAARAHAQMKAAGGGMGDFGPSAPFASTEQAAARAEEQEFELQMMMLLTENQVRDRRNLPNARLLGFLDDINQADGIQRWAGGGDRYNDLIADIEEPRYYIAILAYDFRELVHRQNKKLLWTTRVSVRAPGNRFDDTMAAMLKSAGKYLGQHQYKLVRLEEPKGVVELGNLEFLGEAKAPAAPAETKK